MASTINTNVQSLNAQRNLAASQSSLGTSMQRLSSGLRINSAKDDAAGLAIAERMTSQVRGLNQASRNANDGISLSQVAEGALGSASTTLQRIRELAVQSANATNSASDRAALNAEVNQLNAELQRIAQTAQFNGQNILDGSFTSATFQVGANANQTIIATTGDFRTSKYGNFRVGSEVATTAGGAGDLVVGSQAGLHKTQSTAVADINAKSPIAADPTFRIDGGAGSAVIGVAEGQSARSLASAVNAKAGTTGVTASAHTQAELSNFQAHSSYTLQLRSNNGTPTSISFSVGNLTPDGLSAAVSAFNDKSSSTGVSARINENGNGVTLINETGEDIVLAGTDGGSKLDVGGTTIPDGGNLAAYVTGSLTFDSDRSFGLVGADPGGPGTSFFLTGSAASQLQPVDTLDVTTVESSTRTLSTVDAAISIIAAQRAKFGALQSRFESTITSLQTMSENVSASRSRIQDADFAQETANLSRTQILQQAGTAMVAQANQLPQGVLALLKQ